MGRGGGNASTTDTHRRASYCQPYLAGLLSERGSIPTENPPLTAPWLYGRNRPFFDAIAAQGPSPSEEQTALAQEFLAALLVLRLFTDWADYPEVLQEASEVRTRFREIVAQVADPEAQHLLDTAVSEINKGAGALDVVAAPLAAYAWLLEERDRHDLAEDVLQTVLDGFRMQPNVGNESINYQFIATLHQRLGTLALRQKRLDEAEVHYRQQRDLAKAKGIVSLVFDARIRIIMVRDVRGNLGDADRALAKIIHKAHQANESRAESYARRVRGSVLQRKGQIADALREFYTAFRIAPDWIEQEWLLNDIAACALDLGHRDVARAVFSALRETGHNAHVRTLALINLLEISLLEHDRPAFEAVWKQLVTRMLQREYYFIAHLFAAEGTARWQGKDAGIAAYRKVAEEAQEAGFHEQEFKALDAIRALQGAPAPTDVLPLETSMKVAPLHSLDPSEWGSLTQVIEEACRQRFTASGSADSASFLSKGVLPSD